jgi:valyl-tRNA synthetase
MDERNYCLTKLEAKMSKLPKQYLPSDYEPKLAQSWLSLGTSNFHLESAKPVFSIDTPPPTVSGHLHLGHVYSYSHTDFIARFYRMRGCNVFYPMGFDDNGLPTERLVEKRLGKTAAEVGRQRFIESCLQVGLDAEIEYRELWERLGLSIDWRYSYRTIGTLARKTSQKSFIDLYQKGFAYLKDAPTNWCPECHTALAQADLNDLTRETEFITLDFYIDEGRNLPISTTRPELIPACVAIFVHPDDSRYRDLVGSQAKVPLFGRKVPILTDTGADPKKGTGAVMCCTFGDATDVSWWNVHRLPFIPLIGRDGRLGPAGGILADLTVKEARVKIIQTLREEKLITNTQVILQSVRVHERCDTPVETIVTRQWFIRLLDQREIMIKAGESIHWYPELMQERYRDWVEGLNWDWCISRQRTYGIPFPVWYCQSCGEVILAEESQLPVNPLDSTPLHSCPKCGSEEFSPEEDILDTWATSSMSPQIVGQWLDNPNLYQKVFPFSLRPQAHEIIRTWAFYTIVKSIDHFNVLPWKDVAISGWGLAGEGFGKISKSRAGGPMPPLEMIQKYSADAVRYWAASTGLGKDAVINEEKIQAGARLVIKLWNVARFAERFLVEVGENFDPTLFSPADRWILSRLHRLIQRTTTLLLQYDYAAAKNEIEIFFWTELADNYLEMCKQRLYATDDTTAIGARTCISILLLATIKLFAPFLPFITEAIYHALFAEKEGCPSIHQSNWPEVNSVYLDEKVESFGEVLLGIATAVRRYKSERNLSLGTELTAVQLALGKTAQDNQSDLFSYLQASQKDLCSITRATEIVLEHKPLSTSILVGETGMVKIYIVE